MGARGSKKVNISNYRLQSKICFRIIITQNGLSQRSEFLLFRTLKDKYVDRKTVRVCFCVLNKFLVIPAINFAKYRRALPD